ncbi:MAG TPA: hypothetical protein VL053_01990 [Arachidicoccus sp.]|nr:hypothetical protein [Arachidicoccus sp.]
MYYKTTATVDFSDYKALKRALISRIKAGYDPCGNLAMGRDNYSEHSWCAYDNTKN